MQHSLCPKMCAQVLAAIHAGIKGIKHAMIPDIEQRGFVFTDGCGFMSSKFAKDVSKFCKLIVNSQRYVPSVVQVSYRYAPRSVKLLHVTS